jgi:hypothetical protein
MIHYGQSASFCQSYRFVCSFIPHFLPFLPTLIILVDFFYLLTSFFYGRSFSLLLMFPPSPAFTVERSNPSNSLSHRRRTDIHATTYACFVGSDHGLFDGCIDSALNNVSICSSCTARQLEIRSIPVPTVPLSNVVQQPVVTGSCPCQP